MRPFLFLLLLISVTAHAELPNILWITSEDNSPMLGCYGDPVARTPNIDRLAEKGVRYLNCFSNAAVCAPARQTLITGMYATSLGGQHMRSKAIYPPGVEFFPKYLRDAGYYTTNNSKTDYNGGPVDSKAAMSAAWDESSNKAHWRKGPDGAPFFAVFNFTESHESRLFPKKWKDRETKTDPASVVLPGFLPDLPETRRDMARYYDCLESMDTRVGAVLKELEEDGLADETIVFYFSDHGGSMPRGKSFAYDSGTHVPLIVHIPEKWAKQRPGDPGATTDQLVSFVDFSATVLSLAGIEAPDYMQGVPFLGDRKEEERTYVHTFRGRRGERYDIVRGVRSKDYLYVRNYTPHLPVMQFNAYSFEIPGYPAWQEAVELGEATPEQARWFEPKVKEELYRVSDDPDNIQNLADDLELAEVLAQHRAENTRHMLAIRDSAFYPEGALGREFSAYQNDESYPLEKLIALNDSGTLKGFLEAISDDNACVRYSAATGCLLLGEGARTAIPNLLPLLEDSDPVVQIQAARTLAGLGETDEAIPVLRKALSSGSDYLALQALLAIDECDLQSVDASLRDDISQVKRAGYTVRVVEKLLEPEGSESQ